MRQSSASSARPSHAQSLASQTSNANLNAKLLENKKEYDALSALERASAEYVRRMEALNKDCETMADAGKVLGEVLAQWPNMFRILNLYVAGRETSLTGSEVDGPQQPQSGERLVRVPVDALQQTDSDTKS